MLAGTGKQCATAECWLQSPRSAKLRIGQPTSWTKVGRLQLGSARLTRQRVTAHASIRPLIQVSILEGGRHNSSQFHEDLSVFLISESLTRLAL